VRSLGKKGDGRWRDVVERRVRYTEHKIRRRESNPTSGLILIGDQVDNATME
jgi:hypothetical protein